MRPNVRRGAKGLRASVGGSVVVMRGPSSERGAGRARTSASRGAARSPTATSMSPGRRPGASAPQASRRRACAPPRGRRLEPGQRGHRGETRRGGSRSRQEREVGRRREAVRAERERDAVGEQRAHVGQAAADVEVRARAQDDGRAGVTREAAVVRGGVDHVHEQRRRRAREGAQAREVGDGLLAGTRLATSTPIASRTGRHRPVPSRRSASSSTSSATWIEVGRPVRAAAAKMRWRRLRSAE